MLSITLIALIVLGALAWHRGCRCPECIFHVNERRVAELRSVELMHDVQHKGAGFRDGAPDKFRCQDPSCPRNKEGV